MTKCPYVPPHEWAVDFPHLMLRAKAHKHRKHGATLGERILASPQAVGRIAGVPVVAEIVNAVNGSKLGRKVLDAALGVDGSAPLPRYHGVSARQQLARRKRPAIVPVATPRTSGRVALFTTCYGNHNMPDLATDLCAVFEHNGVTVDLAAREQCCGMPRMELGDLDTVAKYKEVNIPELKGLIAQGFDIVAPIPSCVLMFKQELPLLFPEDPDVQAVSKRIFDPFEYLWLRHEAGLLRTDFQQSLGKISYHAPCHLRVQNIGYKTRDILQLVPETRIELIERCSGHDGTYGVKKKFRAASMKIAKPVIDRVAAAGANSYSSDCPMAGAQIGSGLSDGRAPEHPLLLLRRAYGL
jgi:Fe-S oxidoreductase